jgi:hypothetical protein
MAKQGMRRPSPDDPKNHGTEKHNYAKFPKNKVSPVPELQGKAKNTHKKSNPI